MKPSLLYLLDLTIYYSKEDLNGTCYMEIKPSKYDGKCWEKGSIFIDEEAFGIFEWAFKKNIRNYDRYKFINTSSRNLLKVAKELAHFGQMIEETKSRDDLRNYCQMATEYLEIELDRTLRYQCKELVSTTSEIVQWIRDRSKETKHFAILGI